MREGRVNNERVNNEGVGLKALRCIACGRATVGSAAVGTWPPHGRMTSHAKVDDLVIWA